MYCAPEIKSKIQRFRQFILVVLIICGSNIKIFSQGTDINAGKHPGVFVGFSFIPAQSQIIDKGINSTSTILYGKQNTISGSIDIGYFFSNMAGLSTGIGYDSYGSELTRATYQNSLNTKDSESESYELRVSASDVKEIQKVGSLKIPLIFIFRIPLSGTFGFYVEPGLNLNFPLSKEFTSSGIFTYKGYYPSYNIVLENLPSHGFPSNKNTETEGKLELKHFWANAFASAGIDLLIQRKVQIAAGVCYFKSFSNISGYKSADVYQLSSATDQINSLMGESKETIVQCMGLKISLRYYLK